jgi:hypothetical protein
MSLVMQACLNPGMTLKKIQNQKLCLGKAGQKPTNDHRDVAFRQALRTGYRSTQISESRNKENPKREASNSHLLGLAELAKSDAAIFAGRRSNFCRPLQQILLLSGIFLNH